MKEVIASLVIEYGSQAKVAQELGITDRAFRNYVRKPEAIPVPMQKLMRSMLFIPQPAPEEAQP